MPVVPHIYINGAGFIQRQHCDINQNGQGNNKRGNWRPRVMAESGGQPKSTTGKLIPVRSTITLGRWPDIAGKNIENGINTDKTNADR